MNREELARRMYVVVEPTDNWERESEAYQERYLLMADAALEALKPKAADEARTDSPIVAAALNAGLSPLAAIQPLVDLTDRMVRRVIELERIAPRAIVGPDGRKLIWRCPDEFVPTNEVKL